LYDELSDVLVAYSDALRKSPVDQRGDIVIGYVLDDHEVKWWQEERNYEIDLLGKTESKTYSAQNQHAYRRKHCKRIIAEAIGESLADRLFDFDKPQLNDSVISDLKNYCPEEIQALKGLKDQSLLSPCSTYMSKPVLGPMKNIMTTRRNFRDGRSVTTYKYLKTEENTKLNWCWIMTDIQQLFSLLALICLSMMLRYGNLRAIAGEFAVLLKSRENCSRSYTDFKKYRALSATYLNIHRQNVYFSAQELALLECFWTLLSELYTPRYTLNIEDYIALPKIERLLSCLHSLTAIDPQAELAFNTHGKALLYLPSQGGIREEYMRLITEVLSLA
jgi:hypothetical protein